MSDAVRVVVVEKLRSREAYIWVWEDTEANRKAIIYKAIHYALREDLSWNMKNADAFTDIVIGDEG